MKLTGLDRLNIINKILPEKGGMLEMQTKRELLDIVAIKTKEFPDYGLKEPTPGQVTWDREKIKKEKQFDLNGEHISLLKKGVEILDKGKSIDMILLETCEKINKYEK